MAAIFFDLDGTLVDPFLDVAAARANGIGAWGAAWGYGTAAELHSAGAAHVFHAPHDIAAALNSAPGRLSAR